jgi:purine-binding chemotaxis protein CheW
MTPASNLTLLMRAGALRCAVPASEVIEVMRSLPAQPVEDAPAFVCGLAVIRGEAVPVVDLRILLSTSRDSPAARWVTVRTGRRRVALAADEVFGLRELPSVGELPPLLRDVQGQAVEALSVLDADLLTLLKVSGIVPDDVWDSVDRLKELA